MKVATITSGKKTQVAVSDSVFASPVNKQLLAQAVRVYLSNLRQGTSRVQSRGEVSLTKRKMYAQKGTGNARHGAKSAPIFVGGGVAHGPTGKQNWTKVLPPVMKKKALLSALSAQASAEKVIVLDEVLALAGKTKEAAALFAQVTTDQRVLVIIPEYNPIIARACRNLPHVLVRTASRVNVLEVASTNWVVITTPAIAILEERLTKQVAQKA